MSAHDSLPPDPFSIAPVTGSFTTRHFMMRGSSPRAPWRSRAWLLAMGVLLASGGVLAVMLLAWLALPLPAGGLAGVLRLELAIVGMNVAASLGGLLALSRIEKRWKGGAPGPVQDTFALPVRVGIGAGVGATLIAGVDVMSGGAISGLEGTTILACTALAFAIHQNLAVHLASAWRLVLWREFLFGLAPSKVPVRDRPLLARRYSWRVASALALLGGSVLAVPLAYQAEGAADRPVLFAIAGLTVVAIAAFGIAMGSRIGQRVAADVRVLAAHVRNLRDQAERGRSVPPPSGQLNTTVGEALAARSAALAEYHEERAREQARARQTVEETQRLKTRFLAHMSHDLRSPLHSITGFAEILAQGAEGPLNEEQRASVDAIRESGLVLSRLVTDIVDTARLEAGRMPLHRQPTALGPLIDEAIETALAAAPRKPLKFERFLPDWPDFDVDRERLLQAFVGVIGHVVRMTPEGRIGIEGEDTMDGRVLIRVEALGLPPEDSQRIFVAFRDIKKPSGVREGGLGLGLALARSLVAAHGGELLYSGLDIGGACFTFILPGPAPLPGTVPL